MQVAHRRLEGVSLRWFLMSFEPFDLYGRQLLVPLEQDFSSDE